MNPVCPPVVFDVDMTLTSEWYVNNQVENLRPYRPIVDLAQFFSSEGCPLLISTARPRSLEGGTLKWLKSVGIIPVSIYMREIGNDSPDHFVKYAHIQDIISKHGKPLMWFDDNVDNCAIVRSFDIPCIQVQQAHLTP